MLPASTGPPANGVTLACRLCGAEPGTSTSPSCAAPRVKTGASPSALSVAARIKGKRSARPSCIGEKAAAPGSRPEPHPPGRCGFYYASDCRPAVGPEGNRTAAGSSAVALCRPFQAVAVSRPSKIQVCGSAKVSRLKPSKIQAGSARRAATPASLVSTAEVLARAYAVPDISTV